MKIGIYGGTFDPIHAGHISIAREVKIELKLDRCLFVVAADPPHKDIAGRTPAATRLEMVRLALERERGLFASDIEIKRGGVSYTADTVAELARRYPRAQLYFILGADMLASFETWYMPEKILSHATLVAVQREGQEEDLDALASSITSRLGGRIIVTGVCGQELSSTEIRKRVFVAQPIAKLVPYQAELYIHEKLLYAPDELLRIKDKLSVMLDSQRLRHTMLTAREAILLADRYGLDTQKARLCALLHDCAKLRGRMLENYMAKLDFAPTDEERENPYMIHARLGAVAAVRDYGVSDPEILSAIEKHTLGAPDMTPFDEVIFLADKLEPSRDYRKIAPLRELAYRDLDTAVVEVIKNNIAFNDSKGIAVHPSTFDTLRAIERRIGASKT